MKILEIKNLNFSYDDKAILSNINLYVNKGEVVSIIGKSGVGKSTLFNLITNVIEHKEKNIIINSNSSPKIGYMQQKDLLFEHKTIFENLKLPLILNKKNNIDETVENYLKEFNMLEYKNLYPKELSGGLKQRISFIRTILLNCPIYLLDEPFSALDYITKTNIHNWFITTQKKLEFTALLITHDIDEALKLSNRIYILNKTITDEIIIKDNNLSKYKDILIDKIISVE